MLLKVLILIQKTPALTEKGTISELKAAILTLKTLALVQKVPTSNKKAAKSSETFQRNPGMSLFFIQKCSVNSRRWINL